MILNAPDDNHFEKDHDICEKLISDMEIETFNIGDNTIFTGELVKIKIINFVFQIFVIIYLYEIFKLI